MKPQLYCDSAGMQFMHADDPNPNDPTETVKEFFDKEEDGYFGELCASDPVAVE